MPPGSPFCYSIDDCSAYSGHGRNETGGLSLNDDKAADFLDPGFDERSVGVLTADKNRWLYSPPLRPHIIVVSLDIAEE